MERGDHSAATADRESDPPGLSRARALVEGYHREELELTDAELDRALGFGESVLADAIAGETDAALQHPRESIVHLATPYIRVRSFFQVARPGADDVVVDMGCGTGRVVVYGSLVSPARFVGIELVEPRARVAREAVARLGLPRASVVTGNVLEHPLETGTVFFAFRPFSDETEPRVLGRLHALARSRPITVGAYRFRPGLFDPEVFACDEIGDLRVYRSRG